jgi:hypothetical protein
LAVLPPGAASAQFGDWGWGGWGMQMSGTVEGHALTGSGILAAGLGQFNRDTAVANSINAETIMRLNEYLYQSQQAVQEKRLERVRARRNQRNATLAQIEEGLLYSPSSAEVISGDALNAMLRQFQNPSIPSSAIYTVGANQTLAGSDTRLIPLKFSSRGAILSVERLAARDSWPLALLGEEFKPFRDRYAALVEEVKNRPEDEVIPDAKIVEGIQLITQLREKANADLKGRDFVEAERFLKGHLAMLQMARQPDIRRVLDKASRMESISVADLLSFMEAYRMEFGVARTPEERSLYIDRIFPAMRTLRDGIEKELGGRIQTGTQLARANNPASRPTQVADDLPFDKLANPAPPVAPEPVDPPRPGVAQP